jgi:hypothetical protein
MPPAPEVVRGHADARGRPAQEVEVRVSGELLVSSPRRGQHDSDTELEEPHAPDVFRTQRQTLGQTGRRTALLGRRRAKRWGRPST